MASRRQRSRKRARRVQHVRAQRARLRASLDSLGPGSWSEITKQMEKRGYEPHEMAPGKWRRRGK